MELKTYQTIHHLMVTISWMFTTAILTVGLCRPENATMIQGILLGCQVGLLLTFLIISLIVYQKLNKENTN